LYPEDGKYYQCVIEKITEAGYYVKFKKHNNKEVISLYYLREPKMSLGKRGEDEFADMTEFKAPENLRVLPNDTLEERNKKKKKIKHLKQRWKTSLIEKDLSGKMGKWGDFNVGAAETKKGYFMMNKNRQSIFKSPEGVDGKVIFSNFTNQGWSHGQWKGDDQFHPERKIQFERQFLSMARFQLNNFGLLGQNRNFNAPYAANF
jgi:hypothetical protein